MWNNLKLTLNLTSYIFTGCPNILFFRKFQRWVSYWANFLLMILEFTKWYLILGLVIPIDLFPKALDSVFGTESSASLKPNNFGTDFIITKPIVQASSTKLQVSIADLLQKLRVVLHIVQSINFRESIWGGGGVSPPPKSVEKLQSRWVTWARTQSFPSKIVTPYWRPFFL